MESVGHGSGRSHSGRCDRGQGADRATSNKLSRGYAGEIRGAKDAKRGVSDGYALRTVRKVSSKKNFFVELRNPNAHKHTCALLRDHYAKWQRVGSYATLDDAMKSVGTRKFTNQDYERRVVDRSGNVLFIKELGD